MNKSKYKVMTKYDIINYFYYVFFLVNRSPTVPNVQVGGSASVGCVTVRRGGPGRSVIVTREGPRRRPVAQWQGRVTAIIFLYACIHVFIQFKNAFYFQKAKHNYIICF